MSAAPVGTTSGAVSEAVARVEAELSAFWSAPESEASPQSIGGGPASRAAKVRASTLNYVVICAPEDADAYRDAAEKLSETHGGRTLLLMMSGRLAPWDLVPDVHAVCRIDNAIPICYDRVDLTFGAVAASRAGSVVGALALAELPTIVEIGAGAPAPLVDAVAARFDRLIVDSGKTSAGTIAKIVARTKCPVADRAMIRTYAWRELTARFFDEATAGLKDVRRVEITRTAPAARAAGQIGGGAQDPAALVLGWLGSRLGWSWNGRGVARDARGELVDLVVTSDDRSDVGPGQITGIRIECVLEGQPLECALERATGAPAVRWKMRGARSADREHALGFHDETWVAIKAIDSTEGDRVTRATLLTAADWEAQR